MTERELKAVLEEVGLVTDQIRQLYFSKMTPTQIRYWLNVYGLDTTMPIESPKAPETLSDLKNFLQVHGIVTKLIRQKWFDGWEFKRIRDWLEKNGLNRHMCLELDSTEIVLKDPDHIILQERKTETTPDGRKMCGFFGGVTQKGETPLECASRELKEETGRNFAITDEVNLVETNSHCHEYDPPKGSTEGDKVLYHTHRYVVETFINLAELVMDENEATKPVKVYEVNETVLSHQREFARLVLLCASVSEIKQAIAKRVTPF